MSASTTFGRPPSGNAIHGIGSMSPLAAGACFSHSPIHRARLPSRKEIDMLHWRMTHACKHRSISLPRKRVGAVSIAIALILLGACRPVSAVMDSHTQSAKEHLAMTTPATSNASPETHSSLNAKQALGQFLELIRTTKAVQEVTADRLQQTIGVPIKIETPEHYGYGQALAGGWAFSIERQVLSSGHPEVNLSFDSLPGKGASSKDICDPDFSRFTGALEHMGFTRHAMHGEHHRWLFDYFERPGMRVEVYPFVSQSDTGEPIGPKCVRRVLVR
jgi:hypothetical protein